MAQPPRNLLRGWSDEFVTHSEYKAGGLLQLEEVLRWNVVLEDEVHRALGCHELRTPGGRLHANSPSQLIGTDVALVEDKTRSSRFRDGSDDHVRGGAN